MKKAVLKYLTGKNERARKIVKNADFRKSSKIGVITNNFYSGNSHIDELCEELKKEGKKIKKISFSNRSKGTLSGSFRSKDVGIFGSIRSEYLKQFLDEKFDFLLCFDDSNHYVVQYAVSKAKALCRIGFRHSSENPIYEMTVKVDLNQPSAIVEIMKYLKMIQINE